PTTDNYTLSLHDALPICGKIFAGCCFRREQLPGLRQRDRLAETMGLGAGRNLGLAAFLCGAAFFAIHVRKRPPSDAVAPPSRVGDRKSTRLNSSHLVISY